MAKKSLPKKPFKPKRRRDRKVLGLFDGKEIHADYVKKVYGQRWTLEANQTKAEKAFAATAGSWLYRLNAKFRPQQVFFLADQVSFIADFYFAEFGFIVEIDGSSHYGERGRQYDQWRDGSLLEHCGIKTLRFTNKRVLTDPNGVFKSILNEILQNGRPKSKPYKLFLRCYEKHRNGWLTEMLGEDETANQNAVADFFRATEGL